jgi:hypothetical protein
MLKPRCIYISGVFLPARYGSTYLVVATMRLCCVGGGGRPRSSRTCTCHHRTRPHWRGRPAGITKRHKSMEIDVERTYMISCLRKHGWAHVQRSGLRLRVITIGLRHISQGVFFGVHHSFPFIMWPDPTVWNIASSRSARKCRHHAIQIFRSKPGHHPIQQLGQMYQS